MYDLHRHGEPGTQRQTQKTRSLPRSTGAVALAEKAVGRYRDQVPDLASAIIGGQSYGGRVATLLAAVPSGSYLVLSHIAADLTDVAMATVSSRLDEKMRTTYPPAVRTLEEVAGFFATLELVEPGVVPAEDWHPECGESAEPDRSTPLYAAVGRKP